MLQDKTPAQTPLSRLGEFGLIHHLTEKFPLRRKETRTGIGDDAAVLDMREGMSLWSTDMLVEGVHFDPAYTPYKHLGYKAVIVNLSDIYAMNAEPTHITVSIAASSRYSVEILEEIYAGIRLACELYEVDLVGGDTTTTPRGLQISVGVMGKAKAEDIVYRSGAHVNDLLVVTGDLAAAYLGLQVLEREKRVVEVNPGAEPDLTPYAYLVERQLKPEARRDIIRLFKELKLKPTSMIDISDGLSSEILHLCKASGMGCYLYEEKIPLDPQVINTLEEFDLEHTTIALSSGEDYELLFTISQKDYDKIKGNPNFTVIGHMADAGEGAHLITRAGQKVELIARGWNSFE